MSDLVKKLAQAKQLLDAGVLSEVEYQKKREQYLAELGLSDDENDHNDAPFAVDQATRMGSGVDFQQGTIIGDVGQENSLVVGSSLDTNSSHIGTVISEIGQYRVLDLLGEGGMGSVYRGRHKNDVMAEAEGDVAIKLIKPELAQDTHLQQRFVKEAAL